MNKSLLLFFCTALSFSTYSQNNCNVIPDTVSFGECAMFIGVGYNESLGCIGYSGCSFLGSDGIDYQEFFYSSVEDCEFQCDTCELMPPGVDFGPCDMLLGFANVSGQGCVALSGCGYLGNDNVDYTNYFYSSSYECAQSCSSDSLVSICIDESLIDMSVLCPMIYLPVCGCDGVTYANDCIATNYYGITSWVEGECITAVEEFDSSLLNLYPNPAQEVIFLQNSSNYKISRIEVYDQVGRMVMTKPIVTQQQIALDIDALPKGSYHLRISLENVSAPITKPFIK